MIKTASAAALLALSLAARAAAADAPKVDFVKEIQPILEKSCVKCHSFDPAKPKKKGAGDLRLDDKELAFKGGRSGADILPGKAADSKLFQLLNGPVELEDGKDLDPMPKVKKGEKWKPLPKDQIELIKRWINEGAAWPKDAKPVAAKPAAEPAAPK